VKTRVRAITCVPTMDCNFAAATYHSIRLIWQMPLPSRRTRSPAMYGAAVCHRDSPQLVALPPSFQIQCLIGIHGGTSLRWCRSGRSYIGIRTDEDLTVFGTTTEARLWHEKRPV
jgi:hypothetical protein